MAWIQQAMACSKSEAVDLIIKSQHDFDQMHDRCAWEKQNDQQALEAWKERQ